MSLLDYYQTNKHPVILKSCAPSVPAGSLREEPAFRGVVVEQSVSR